MSNKGNKEELKIKEQFLINIKSRNDEKKLKFTKWLNAQSNPQNSFLSLIEHCIDRFGYEDVTDHEIAKRLHTEILYFNNSDIAQSNLKMEEVNNQQTETKEIPEKIMRPKENKLTNKIEQKKDEEEEKNIVADLNSF